MSLEDLGLIDYEVVDKTLHIDGDIVIYQPCCVFDEDDDQSRRMIAKQVNKKIEDLMNAAGCNTYIMFVTTNFNFRDHLVDDYKANRSDKPKPVNLAWAKQWGVKNLNTHYVKWLEADDLLGIYQTEDTVLWSLDKDLRQVKGYHLDDATQKVVSITDNGSLKKEVIYKPDGRIKKTKYHFTGTIGLYFQMLSGDSTDWIVGCGKRNPRPEGKTVRAGVGQGKAYDILMKAGSVEAGLLAVADEYCKLHKGNWQKELETQANLLFMVREIDGEIIKRWTFDKRDEYMNIVTGEITDGNSKST
jgi:5'-3' exonuclease